MELLHVVLSLLKVIGFTIVFIPWSIYIIYRFTKTKWNLFSTTKHKLPERLTRDYNHSVAKLSTGVDIHYVSKGDSSNPLILFVHGFPEFWYTWRYQIDYFAKTHHVIALDQRGYGGSSKPDGVENYTARVLSTDIKEFIEQSGHKQAILVGHDWGGAVAWMTTQLYPEVVSKLIIMNCPHPGAYETVMKNVWMQMLRSWYILFFQTAWIPEITVGLDDFEALDFAFRSDFTGVKNKKNFTDEDLEAWKATFSGKGALTAPINYYRAVVRHRSDAQLFIHRVIKPPTLIIWGEEDPFLTIECAAYSENMCLKGKIEYVKGSSHWVQQDEPEKVNQLMEKFIN